MKRNVLFILLVFGLVGMAWAQGWPRMRPDPAPKSDGSKPHRELPAAETVTVSGGLIVAYGSPAVKSGDVTYLVKGINRLVGFVDGLKEGAQVTVEGPAITSPRDSKLKVLRPAKLTLNGKTYDLAPLAFSAPFGPNRQSGPGHRNQMPPAPQGRDRRPAPQEYRQWGRPRIL